MLTLQELKRITESPEKGRRVPTARHLRDCGVEVASKSLYEDAQITAYQNGYAIYSAGNHSTVISIHSCRDYLYESSGRVVCIGEPYFKSMEWYVRLILEGEDRLFHNQEVRERAKSVSYHVVSGEWPAMADVDQFLLDHIIQNEIIHELLGLLTERQRLVVSQFFIGQKTQKQISDELGITAPAVSKTISQALRRIRKNLDRELVESWRGGMSYAW